MVRRASKRQIFSGWRRDLRVADRAVRGCRHCSQHPGSTAGDQGRMPVNRKTRSRLDNRGRRLRSVRGTRVEVSLISDAPYIQHASVWSGTATKPNKMSSVSIAWLRCPFPHVSSKKSTEPDPNCLISPSDTSTATDPLSISENCLAGAGCQPRAIASGLVLISRKLVASIDAVDSISGRPGADGMIDSDSSRSAKCDSPCSST